MSDRPHPYTRLPPYRLWRKAVADLPVAEVDPVVGFPFRLTASDKIATAGSCFAQHIARHLIALGFNYHVTEPAHPMLDAKLAQAFNYGVFSARYGNLYTTRQLRQLFDRAFGRYRPADDAWRTDDGRWIDPYRPQIQPEGFLSQREFEVDRARHLAAVRRLFETLDVFVFTLGLTEAWCARSDGAVYPVCPGVSGGVFDPAQHVFHNFNAAEVGADLLAFIDALREVNPKARVMLTVSPVPLIATAEDRHVLVSTTYSKAALRVACEQVCSERPGVAYFPSYDIITGGYTRGLYFAADQRSVTEAGVEQVMKLFVRHCTEAKASGAGRPPARPAAAASATAADQHLAENARLAQVNCDEEALDRRLPD